MSWLGMPLGSSRKVRSHGSLLGVAEKLHVLEALRPAEQRADGDDQDVLELVQPGALDARIGQFAQDAQEIGSLGGCEFESVHPKRASEPTLKAQ